MYKPLNAKIINDNLTCYDDNFSVNLRYYICADCLRLDGREVYSASVFDVDNGGDRIEYCLCDSKEEALVNYCLLLETYMDKD